MFVLLYPNPVGVFDSGLGGISVLKAIRRQLPKENLLYFADKENAPYGNKSDEEILALTRRGADILIRNGAKAIVIACNTATSVAAEVLRCELDTLVIGLEPAIKPAFFNCKIGKILVLATPVTISHGKFQHLLSFLDSSRFVCVAAPELVPYVESGMHNRAKAIEYLKELLAPYIEIKFCACVLGCTHFPFVKEEITEALGYCVPFFDGALGAARELDRRLCELGLLNKSAERGSVTWLTSYPDNIQNKLLFNKI